MATRLYLIDGTDMGLTPAFDANWGVTTSADRSTLFPYKNNTANVSKTSGASGTTTAISVLNRQFISVPLVAQTISGTFAGQIAGLVSSTTGAVALPAVSVRVFSNDCTTVRAILYSDVTTGTGTAYTTTSTNRSHPAATSVTSYTCVTGDRLVIEIGFRKTSGTTSITATQVFSGNYASTDQAVNNTNTTALPSWVEFSMDLEFQTGSNLLSVPEDFSSATWTKAGMLVTANAIAAPDGLITADKVYEDTSTTTHLISQTYSFATYQNYFTVAVYAKAAGNTTVSLRNRQVTGSTPSNAFDISAGTATASTSAPRIEDIGNGWYRISTTIYQSTGATTPHIAVIVPGGSILGDGTSGYYLWGATANWGYYPVSYYVPAELTKRLGLLGVG